MPCTVALHCEVALIAIAEGVQTGETEEMEEMLEDMEPEWPPPPQAESRISSSDIPRTCRWRGLQGLSARWRREPPILICYAEIDWPSVSFRW